MKTMRIVKAIKLTEDGTANIKCPVIDKRLLIASGFRRIRNAKKYEQNNID